MFDHLRLACQLGIPLTVKGGARIGISGVCLYTALREDRAAAEKEVRDGLGRLIQDAHEIVLDLDEAGPAGANR